MDEGITNTGHVIDRVPVELSQSTVEALRQLEMLHPEWNEEGQTAAKDVE